MKERYIKIEGWYFPIDGVLFATHPERGTVSIHEIGGNDDRLWEVQGKRATLLLGLLDELSLDIDAASELE